MSLPLLNDLEWLLTGHETFVTDYPLSEYLVSDWRERLRALRLAPEPLLGYMSQAKSHFLGTYFEQLFSFAVRQFTDLTLLAEHQQIHDGAKTLGEVDLLAQDRDGRCIQFEVALKFYLHRPDLAPTDWIGPNKNDSLQKKVRHARTHQLEVLSQDDGRIWLESIAKTLGYQRNLMIYGRHFYALNSDHASILSQPNYHGGWIYIDQLISLAGVLADLTPAHKPQWITPIIDASETFSIDDHLIQRLSDSFVNDERPALFSCQRQQGLAPRQVFWLFVCPNDW